MNNYNNTIYILLFAQKPLPAYEDFKKSPWVCLSTDLPLYTAEFRCRDACDKNQMEETKAESKILRMELDVTSMMAFWMNLVDGLGVVACWRVGQIIKYRQLTYNSILMCFMLKVLPVHCKFMNMYMVFCEW